MKTRQEQEQEQEQEGSENVGQYSDHNNADIVNNKVMYCWYNVRVG